MIRYELYFGRNIGTDGQTITLDQWEKFVDEEIALRFDGFSLHYLTGFWKGKPEETTKVEIMVPCDENHPAAKRNIAEIRQRYCKQFQQESVMLVISDVEVMF